MQLDTTARKGNGSPWSPICHLAKPVQVHLPVWTAADLVRFAQCHLSGGKASDGTQSFVKVVCSSHAAVSCTCMPVLTTRYQRLGAGLVIDEMVRSTSLRAYRGLPGPFFFPVHNSLMKTLPWHFSQTAVGIGHFHCSSQFVR